MTDEVPDIAPDIDTDDIDTAEMSTAERPLLIGRSDLPGQPLPDDTPTLVHTAVGWMHRRFRTSADTDGLPYTAIALVNRIRLAGPQTVAALAAWDATTEATVSQTAARLIEGGYLDQVTERDGQGRQVQLRATERGIECAARWYRESIEWVAEHVDRLPDEDRDALRRASLILIDIARS